MAENIIEVELRGQLSEREFIRVSEYLSQHNDSRKKEDNKTTYFFVTTGFILKVADEISKNRAKITIKAGDETQAILREFDIYISREKVMDAVFLFRTIGFEKVNKVEQVRINYEYNGASIAMKHTQDWGYHFEVDAEVKSIEDAKYKEIELRGICEKLNIIPMTPEQIKDKIEQINKSHGFI